jgi:hypothetical protein
MLASEDSIIAANYVPNAGKAAASAFANGTKILRVGLNKGAQQNVWLI